MGDGCPKKVALDFSKIAYINQPEVMSVWEVVVKCVVVGILLLLAVVGNTLVIVIVFLFPKMRTTTNYYIVNLAIADLLVACFPMWIHVTTDVTDGFVLGPFFCKFNAFLQMMSVWEVVVKCVVVGILLLLAVVGNTLVIVIVFLFPKMRTTTNYYIVNLAIADLLVACFPMWIHVTTDVTDGFVLGPFFCKFNAFLQTSAISAISFTMMVIAGDRFFAIVFPLKARVTQRRVKVVVFFIWFFAIPIGIPPAMFYEYTERQWLDYLETFCTDVWPMVKSSEGCDQGATSERIYWTIVVAALNWVPMVMMTINYTLIIHKLRFARMAAHRGKDAISLVQRRSATKVIKMLFSLLIVFMVCTIPFQVATLYENYKDKTTKLQSWYQPVYFSAITLMYGHSSINPIIYGAMNHSFRTGFRHLIDRIRGRKLTSWDYTMNGNTESVMRPAAGLHVIDRSGSGRDNESNGNNGGDVTATKSSQFLQIPNSNTDTTTTPTLPRRRHFYYTAENDGGNSDNHVDESEIKKHHSNNGFSDVVQNGRGTSWDDNDDVVIADADNSALSGKAPPPPPTKNEHLVIVMDDKTDGVWMGDNVDSRTERQRPETSSIDHHYQRNRLDNNDTVVVVSSNTNGPLQNRQS